MRPTAPNLQRSLIGALLLATAAVTAVWVRSIWAADIITSETLRGTVAGGDRHANTMIATLPGGLLFFRQLNEGPS